MKNNDEQLKSVLYEGLIPEIKHQASYKNDMISDYDRFKIELRKIEAELNETAKETKKNVILLLTLKRRSLQKCHKLKIF